MSAQAADFKATKCWVTGREVGCLVQEGAGHVNDVTLIRPWFHCPLCKRRRNGGLRDFWSMWLGPVHPSIFKPIQSASNLARRNASNMAAAQQAHLTLNTGARMPQLAFGTWMAEPLSNVRTKRSLRGMGRPCAVSQLQLMRVQKTAGPCFSKKVAWNKCVSAWIFAWLLFSTQLFMQVKNT